MGLSYLSMNAGPYNSTPCSPIALVFYTTKDVANSMESPQTGNKQEKSTARWPQQHVALLEK